jgi:hypothetical protein
MLKPLHRRDRRGQWVTAALRRIYDSLRLAEVYCTVMNRSKDLPAFDTLDLSPEELEKLELFKAEAEKIMSDEGLPWWQRVVQMGKLIPQEELDRLPADFAKNLDHYLYGSPKIEEV